MVIAVLLLAGSSAGAAAQVPSASQEPSADTPQPPGPPAPVPTPSRMSALFEATPLPLQEPQAPPPEPEHTGLGALMRDTGSDFVSFPRRKAQRLRRKLDEPEGESLIRTRRGLGYQPARRESRDGKLVGDPDRAQQIGQWLPHERRQFRSCVGFLEHRDRVLELGARDAERSDEPLVGGERLEIRRQAQDVVGDPSKLCVTFEDGEGPRRCGRVARARPGPGDTP